eukprot:7327556-Prymnesium_polylepis.1
MLAQTIHACEFTQDRHINRPINIVTTGARRESAHRCLVPVRKHSPRPTATARPLLFFLGRNYAAAKFSCGGVTKCMVRTCDPKRAGRTGSRGADRPSPSAEA